MINILRSLCLSSRWKFTRRRGACALRCLMQLTALALTWNGWISLLPVAANIATILAAYTNNPRKICLAGMLIQFAPLDRLQRLCRFPGGHSGRSCYGIFHGGIHRPVRLEGAGLGGKVARGRSCLHLMEKKFSGFCGENTVFARNASSLPGGDFMGKPGVRKGRKAHTVSSAISGAIIRKPIAPALRRWIS